MPGLVTAMAMVDWLEMGVEGIARLTEAREGWLEVVGECDGMGLVTVVDEFLVVVVVVGVVEVVMKVDAEESDSALLRA